MNNVHAEVRTIECQFAGYDLASELFEVEYHQHKKILFLYLKTKFDIVLAAST